MLDQLENFNESIPRYFLQKYFANVQGSAVLRFTSVHLSDYVLKIGNVFRLH